MRPQMAGLDQPSSRSEITGRDGKPIQVETLVGIVREALNGPEELDRADGTVNGL